MSEQDSKKNIIPSDEKLKDGVTSGNEPAHEGQDLASDPEFLSLAAEFDAALDGFKKNKALKSAEAIAVPQNEKLKTPVEELEQPVEGLNPQVDQLAAQTEEPFTNGKPEQQDGDVQQQPAEEPVSPLVLANDDFLSTDANSQNRAASEEKNYSGEPEKSTGNQNSNNFVNESAESFENKAAGTSFEQSISGRNDQPEDINIKETPNNEETSAKAKRSFFARGNERKPEASAAPKLKTPYLGVTPAASATVLSRVFDVLALGAVFVLVAVYLFQVVPGLQSGRLLWFSDELRQADVLAGVFNGKWLQIYLNGQLYQEAPPLYFWFLMGMHKLLFWGGMDLGNDYAQLLYIGAAISGLFFILATYSLARSTAHLDRRGAFASGCVVLSVLFLQFFFHYSSLDLFFAAFIILSHVFLFKALNRTYAPLLMGLAFLCAAIALMTKGALGLALPILSALLFSVWRGRPQRLLKADFMLGIIFALLPPVIWLGSIWAGGQHELVLQMLKEQVWVKAFGDAAHSEVWWYYLAVLPALWLPWSLLVFTLPWHNIFKRSTWEALKSARNGERQGLAFVWLYFIGAFVLISLVQHKQPVYLVPLMGPLAVLTGRAVLQLSPLRSTILQRLMAVLFFILAVIFVLLPVYYSGDIPSVFSWLDHVQLPAWEVKLNGIFLLSVVTLATTCFLIGVIKARRPESTLLILVLGATLFSYPMSTMTMPSLDNVVSSKAASIEVRRYVNMGYYPIAFKVYPGVFSYYSGMLINETDDWAVLERMVSAHPKVIIAMHANRWKDWTQNPGLIEIMRFWMFSGEYVLLLRNDVPENSFEPLDIFKEPLFENLLPDAELPDALREPEGEPAGEIAPEVPQVPDENFEEPLPDIPEEILPEEPEAGAAENLLPEEGLPDKTEPDDVPLDEVVPQEPLDNSQPGDNSFMELSELSLKISYASADYSYADAQGGYRLGELAAVSGDELSDTVNEAVEGESAVESYDSVSEQNLLVLDEAETAESAGNLEAADEEVNISQEEPVSLESSETFESIDTEATLEEVSASQEEIDNLEEAEADAAAFTEPVQDFDDVLDDAPAEPEVFNEAQDEQDEESGYSPPEYNLPEDVAEDSSETQSEPEAESASDSLNAEPDLATPETGDSLEVPEAPEGEAIAEPRQVDSDGPEENTEVLLLEPAEGASELESEVEANHAQGVSTVEPEQETQVVESGHDTPEAPESEPSAEAGEEPTGESEEEAAESAEDDMEKLPWEPAEVPDSTPLIDTPTPHDPFAPIEME